VPMVTGDIPIWRLKVVSTPPPPAGPVVRFDSDGSRGEFRPRQLPRAVDLKGRFLFLVVVKC
jgi:hypothetical protein